MSLRFCPATWRQGSPDTSSVTSGPDLRTWMMCGCSEHSRWFRISRTTFFVMPAPRSTNLMATCADVAKLLAAQVGIRALTAKHGGAACDCQASVTRKRIQREALSACCVSDTQGHAAPGLAEKSDGLDQALGSPGARRRRLGTAARSRSRHC